MEFQIAKLAKVRLDEVVNLPDCGGIYFVIDDASRVWYVGIATSSLRERHQKHEKKIDFHKHATKIAYFPYNDEDDLTTWEVESINKYRPPLNSNLKDYDLPIVDLGYSKDKFVHRYKEIKLLIKALEQELADLKPAIVTLVEENGSTIRMDGFTVYTVHKPKWQYSSEVSKLACQLDNLKKYEEKKRIATVDSYTIYPVVR